MKKVCIVVGTRPNFIKITQFEKEFARHDQEYDYKIIHTGQHYDDAMSRVFFEQLQLKKPDVFLDVKRKRPAWQIGEMIKALSDYFQQWRPDVVVVVGDCNTAVGGAIAAQKEGITIAHLESGLRSFDREMPEEINRILTDEISDIYFITEQSGLDNLRLEGKIHGEMHFVGNTMIDTLVAFSEGIEQSPVLNNLRVQPGNYALVTMHRPSNVDTPESLSKIIDLLTYVSRKIKVVFPIHPRTRNRAVEFNLMHTIESNEDIILAEPLDYFAFQKLIKECRFVLTDSGGIQEETTFRQVPCLTLRQNTERPSTIDLGTNVLLDGDAESIRSVIDEVMDGRFKKGEVPPMWDGQSTKRIVDILSRAGQ